MQGRDNLNETDFRKRVGNNIAYFRKACGYTQIGLAEKINYSDKAVSKWERGESVPDVFVLYKMSEIFGCTLNDLTGQVGQYEYSEEKLDKIVKNNSFKRKMITAMSVGLLWLVVSVTYFVTDLILNGVYKSDINSIGLIFLYAVPASFIITLVFSKIWGRIWQQAASVSGILWGCVVSLNVSFKVFDFAVSSGIKFIIAAGFFQVLIVLWFLNRSTKK